MMQTPSYKDRPICYMYDVDLSSEENAERFLTMVNMLKCDEDWKAVVNKYLTVEIYCVYLRLATPYVLATLPATDRRVIVEVYQMLRGICKGYDLTRILPFNVRTDKELFSTLDAKLKGDRLPPATPTDVI